MQVLSSHLSVTGYRPVFGGDAERMRRCARLSSRKNRSNGGKTVQAQHCSIRYGEPQRSKDQLNDNRASDFRMELRLSVVKEHLRQGTFFLCQLLSLRPELEDASRVTQCLVQNKQQLGPACSNVFNRPRGARVDRERPIKAQGTMY